ncbi:hypothetical protein MJD09_15205 [bacterium]|nr:hypothetical protein [bacterium]
MSSKLFVVLLSASALFSLAFQQSQENPPAPSFNVAGSDVKAIAIADQVMQAMGGRQNWDDTRYITWKFFGRRFHVWDKHTGNIRVESGNRTVLMNIHTKQGRVWEDGQEITHPDSLAKRLDRGYRAWINDSYWLVMPYKLKDSGVTLKYVGEKKMETGANAEVLQLTFEGVGVTPENKYEVFVNKDSKLVEQWSFFRQASDDQPRFSTPWHEWEQHGKILLSGNRGERGHSDIAVFDELSASVFENPDPVDIMTFPRAAK